MTWPEVVGKFFLALAPLMILWYLMRLRYIQTWRFLPEPDYPKPIRVACHAQCGFEFEDHDAAVVAIAWTAHQAIIHEGDMSTGKVTGR